eukprot:TRINITY_DN34270_c0_g1_i8.p1 TRINITY_DN34270_c0_g1~~TRINITY_DN34270_c0_g1_i8.p1  ORF type:complete len:713 (-),score=150.65 TRINITY_DN34270_c0_g1_i8:129-2267(-)
MSSCATGGYYDSYGLPPEQSMFTPQLFRNRQDQQMVKAWQTVLGDDDIVVSHDRWCFYRPTRDAETGEPAGAKATRQNLHLDLHPWGYRNGSTGIETLRYDVTGDDGTNPRSIRDFPSEINRARHADGPCLQGVLNLDENLPEDGGTQLVPKFHAAFDAWQESLGDVADWEYKPGSVTNWLIPRLEGGASFKFHDKDPINKLGKRISMRAGSMVVWDQRMVHGSCPNASARPRMAQFIKALRRKPITEERATARALAVLREIHHAGLACEVSQLGERVCGFADLPEALRDGAWKSWHPASLPTPSSSSTATVPQDDAQEELAKVQEVCGLKLHFQEALQHLRVVRGDEVAAYSQASVRAFLRESKASLENATYYETKAMPLPKTQSADGADSDFYFVSYVWEPPSGVDPTRALREDEKPHKPSMADGAEDEKNGDRAKLEEPPPGADPADWEAREWYAKAQAKSVYLEFRSQRGFLPKNEYFWIERASLPQRGSLFDLARQRGFFLLEYVLLARALIAVVSPHYFSRGWCLFEFAVKLALASPDDPGAIGVAWKAFASFGSRSDGFPPAVYAEVVRKISIENAEFALQEDREVLLSLVDKLFLSREAFDRFSRFAALLRLGRSCYEKEDRKPFAAAAEAEGFQELADALAADGKFDPKAPDASSALRAFDAAVAPGFACIRSEAVQVDAVEAMNKLAREALHSDGSRDFSRR